MRLSVTRLDLRGKRVFLRTECNGLTVAGGGDTVAAIHRAGVAGRPGYLSPSGAAFLEALEGRELPSVPALSAMTGQPLAAAP